MQLPSLAPIEQLLEFVINIVVFALESMGILIIVVSAVQAMYGYFRRDRTIRLKLAQGLSLALEFKLGSEILKTVLVREWKEILVVGAIIVLRGVLNFLIHWEIKTEIAHSEQSAGTGKGKKG